MIFKIKGSETADRIWAPEVLFDKIRGEYMIYWSHHNVGTEPTVIKYAYTKDFKSLSTEPRVLLRRAAAKTALTPTLFLTAANITFTTKTNTKKRFALPFQTK